MSTITLRGIPTALLRPNPRNVRTDLGNVEELANSLRANGVQQPIIVTPLPGGAFSIVDGHRRHAAAVRAGLPHVPALVTAVAGRRQTVVMMLAAAMHKQLKPIEQARAFRDLQRDGMTINEIARLTGYSRATVLARIGLLDLPAEAQSMVARDELTLGEATKLARQVKVSRTGSARKKQSIRSAWFTRSHRLALTIQERCTHDATTRVHVGAVGCGQCWEDAIRADERGDLAVVPVFDEVAVQRACDGRGGGSRLPRADRLEAVRRLHAKGLSDAQIADRVKATSRQVLRDRQALDLPGNFDGQVAV